VKYPVALTEGILLKREKRFLVHVELPGGEKVIAHTNNTGTMLSCNTPGSKCWLSPASNPKRKLKWTYEIVESDGIKVGINTSFPNTLAEEAILNGAISELQGYRNLRREVKYGNNSRIDILLENDDSRCWVEVKNVTLTDGKGTALFPDAVTARGLKHLHELENMVKQEDRAVMLYIVQRSDAVQFATADKIDPKYAAGLKQAMLNGVEVLCYRAEVSVDGVEIVEPLPILCQTNPASIKTTP